MPLSLSSSSSSSSSSSLSSSSSSSSLQTPRLRTLLVLLLLSSAVVLVAAREYNVRHSFRPPYVANTPLPHWRASPDADAFAHGDRHLVFEPQRDDDAPLAVLVNTDEVDAESWETRVQLWTSGTGVAGLYFYLLNRKSAAADAVTRTQWDGLRVTVRTVKAAGAASDSLELVAESQKRGGGAGAGVVKLLDRCELSYPHNPNLFLLARYLNGRLSFKISVESSVNFQQCIDMQVKVLPGFHFALAPLLVAAADADDDATHAPVQHQYLYAMYTHTNIAPAGNVDAVTADTIGPKPVSKLKELMAKLQAQQAAQQQRLGATSASASASSSSSDASRVEIVNEFFYELRLIEESMDSIGATIHALREQLTSVAMRGDEEIADLDDVMTMMKAQVATRDDLKRLYVQNAANRTEAELAESTAQRHTGVVVQSELSSLRAAMLANQEQMSRLLLRMDEQVKVMRNNIELSGSDYRDVLKKLEQRVAAAAATGGSATAASLVHWLVVVAFEGFFFGALWLLRTRNASSKRHNF